MTLLLALAAAETGTLDTAILVGGTAERTSSDVPEALACADVHVSEYAAVEEPFEVTLNNGCAQAIEVREVDCAEADVDSDHDGCGRLVVQPSGANVEGLSAEGGDGGEVTLEWFIAGDETVLARATWTLSRDHSDGGGWDSGPWDSGPGGGVDRFCGGCDAGVGAGTVGLLGLLLVRRRR